MTSFRDARVLSMEMDPSNETESDYRLQLGRRVVYLTVAPGTFDEDTLRDHAGLLAALPPFPAHGAGTWTACCVGRDAGSGALSATFEARALPGVLPRWHAAAVDCLSLRREALLAPNTVLVSSAALAGPAVAKCARFPFEIPRMAAETAAYARLAGSTDVAPAFLGHVVEGGRVIGLLLEHIAGGRAAGPADLEECRAALQRVHARGLLHGDVNRYNFVVSAHGVRLVDFENSRLDAPRAAMGAEMASLAGQLAEDTGRGGGFVRDASDG
ncbi:MAG: hypothetical protein M1832_001357 [Thelocarpon impressellum]|nr:MAG: hypothetical protein M1832_001357 [Thelocarpon impressellum]